jgi:hypothetical protein
MAETPNDNQRASRERITPLRQAIAAPGALPHLGRLQSWVDTHLSAPHADLGRSGPVCPFTRGASDRDLLWVATVPGPAPAVEDIESDLHAFTDLFRELEPTEGPGALLKAILVTFPDLEDFSVIDTLQRKLKPEFIAAGLMIGQFYPGCAEPGMWNADFRPLDCPVPLIAIRQMVSSDFVFLNSSGTWVENYLRHFAPAIPSATRRRLAAAFDAQDG